VPFQTNKSLLIEKIALLVREKKIEERLKPKKKKKTKL